MSANETEETRPNEHKHDFDGIEELDNDLPRWWLGIFAVSTLFAIFYWPYYHIFHPEELPAAKLESQMAAAAEADGGSDTVEADKVDEEATLQEKYKQPELWKESAKAKFDTYCMPCHLTDGGGTIGPNLTDDYYIHGGKISDILRVIREGVPEKGMISWKTQFKPEEMENLALYVRSMRGTTPANPKAPEGKKVDESGAFIE